MARRKRSEQVTPADEPIDRQEPETAMPEESQRLCAYWKQQISAVDEMNARWHKRGDSIMKRYRDERDRASEEGQRRLNVLWSNIQIFKPAIYSKAPQVSVERRFLDRDPTGRLSATILERVLRNELSENGFHKAISLAVDSRLLPGRGQVWVRYEPKFESGPSIPTMSEMDMKDSQGDLEEPDDSPEEEKLEETGEELVEESVQVDHVNWRDFYIFPARARTWEEVQAVGKKLHMSENECKERFGEEIGSKIQADPTMDTTKDFSNTSIFQQKNERKRIVYEIWNKTDRKVYWVSTGYDDLCDVKDDPLQLDKFFPCPEPLSATLTDDSLVPIPDYIEYQDQAILIDELTQRISMLSKCLRVAGTYDASNRALRRLINETMENDLIPVDNWAMHADKGGIKGSISFFPLEEIVQTIQTCMEIRERVKLDIDLITGVSDVLRGTTDGRETMGGTRLKSNNASSRLEAARSDVARFARDVVRICAEIIAVHFDPQTLVEASGILREEGIVPEPLPTSSPMMQAPPPMPQMPTPGPVHPPGQPIGLAGPPNSPIGAGAVPPNPIGAPPSPMPGPPGGSPGMMPAIMSAPPGLSPLGMPPVIPPMMIAAMKIKKAVDLLRDDIRRGYRIDIETDSTIAGDAMQERQDAIEFIKAITQYIQQSGQIVIAQPESAPLFAKLLQFGVRKFRVGRELESTIDDFADKVEKEALKPSGLKGPSPQQSKDQAAQTKAQAEIQRAILDARTQEQNDLREQQGAQQAADREERKAQMELEIKQQEYAMRMEEMRREQEFKLAEHHMRMAKLTMPQVRNQGNGSVQ